MHLSQRQKVLGCEFMPDCEERSGADGILEALDLALASDHAVFLLGEGVTDPKGIFGTTVGLFEKYGPKRVIETPVAENGFTGIAIGSAMLGQRPIAVSYTHLTLPTILLV